VKILVALAEVNTERRALPLVEQELMRRLT
jgi:hypothetical protein